MYQYVQQKLENYNEIKVQHILWNTLYQDKSVYYTALYIMPGIMKHPVPR